MVIEDILIKVTGDNALATRFIGNASPFPDLRSDLPYFNAVMVVTSRGIMEVKDIVSGCFCAARTGRGGGCPAGDPKNTGRISILMEDKGMRGVSGRHRLGEDIAGHDR